MRNIMAFSAFLELPHNTCRMRDTVAVLAFRYSLVLFLMAEGTCEGIVFGLAGIKQS